jgi:hypothetical protein
LRGLRRRVMGAACGRVHAWLPRLLPILLPSRWTAPVPGGRLWNVGPAYGRQQTVLDDLPKPTDQMLMTGSPTVDMRVEVWVASSQPAVGGYGASRNLRPSVNAGQRLAVKLPGERTREEDLDRTHPPPEVWQRSGWGEEWASPQGRSRAERGQLMSSRDMRGMILYDVKGRHAESPGSSRVRPRTTDALENH